MRLFHSIPWFRSGRKPVNPLAFVHLYKTAGTSINVFLVNRFPAGECCLLYPVPGQTFRELVPSQPKSCYSGHIRYDEMLSIVPTGTTMFTLIRDPIERAQSAYYSFRRFSREELAQRNPVFLPTLDMTFAEFIRSNPLASIWLFGNFQTNKLGRAEECGAVQDGTYAPPTRADLARARDNLSRCLVGTTERLADFLSLLCHERSWPQPDRVPVANQNPQRPRSIDRETREFLEEHTALDAELHRFANELLQERLDQLAPDVETIRKPSRKWAISFDQPIPGFGWYPREEVNGNHFCFCEPRAWLECQVPAKRDLLVEIDTITLLPNEFVSPFSLRINGQELRLSQSPTTEGQTYRGVLPGGIEDESARLEIEVKNPVRPCDVLPDSTDNRLLSLAVKSVRLRAA